MSKERHGGEKEEEEEEAEPGEDKKKGRERKREADEEEKSRCTLPHISSGMREMGSQVGENWWLFPRHCSSLGTN